MASTSNFSSAGSNPRAVARLFKMEVEDAFNAWNDSRPMRTGHPHASNILAPEADFCLRKLVMMAVYPDKAQRPERKPWDVKQNAIFKNGWVLHEKYQSLLHKYSTVALHEGKPELDLTHFDPVRLVYFSPDVVQNHLGEIMPVEIKGYKSSSFEKLDEMGPAPKQAHEQVNFYMHLMELEHGLILVECKDTQDIKVWCVPYDRELVQPYVERMHKYKAAYALHVKQGRPLPERKCTKCTDRLAEKCEMKEYCFSLQQ
jgi:CRISPR/Cas system-associated exonuclease Cas4 (RecB family)